MVNLLLHDLQFHPLKVFHILFAPGLYSLLTIRCLRLVRRDYGRVCEPWMADNGVNA